MKLICVAFCSARKSFAGCSDLHSVKIILQFMKEDFVYISVDIVCYLDWVWIHSTSCFYRPCGCSTDKDFIFMTFVLPWMKQNVKMVFFLRIVLCFKTCTEFNSIQFKVFYSNFCSQRLNYNWIYKVINIKITYIEGKLTGILFHKTNYFVPSTMLFNTL